MLPIGGLSLIVHSLVILGGFFKKTLGLKTQKIKGRFLRWNLKISPRLCFAIFTKDSFLRQMFAYAIIVGFVCVVSINLWLSFNFYLKNNSGPVLVADLVKIGLAMVSEKNTSPAEKTVKFDEVPFAKEIMEADFDVPDSFDGSFN